jgi:hypothetical protein
MMITHPWWSFYTAVQPRRQLWTSYSPPWELESSQILLNSCRTAGDAGPWNSVFERSDLYLPPVIHGIVVELAVICFSAPVVPLRGSLHILPTAGRDQASDSREHCLRQTCCGGNNYKPRRNAKDIHTTRTKYSAKSSESTLCCVRVFDCNNIRMWYFLSVPRKILI